VSLINDAKTTLADPAFDIEATQPSEHFRMTRGLQGRGLSRCGTAAIRFRQIAAGQVASRSQGQGPLDLIAGKMFLGGSPPIAARSQRLQPLTTLSTLLQVPLSRIRLPRGNLTAEHLLQFFSTQAR
jgi:hypothetical protein